MQNRLNKKKLQTWKKKLTSGHNCSLNWQHQLCKNPRPNPDIKTLFVDHSCGQPNNTRAPSPANPLLGSVPKAGGFPPLGIHGVHDVIYCYHFFFFGCLLIGFLTHYRSMSSAISACSSCNCNSSGWLDVKSIFSDSSNCFWCTYRAWRSTCAR